MSASVAVAAAASAASAASNTKDHWRDNRLDYFFAHMDEVVAAHIVGLFFGAGAAGMTTPETDGGNFVSKTAAYRAAGGTKVCP